MNQYRIVDPALLTDLYELTMMQGYYFYRRDSSFVFDMFFRQQPFGGGYSVFAGLEPLLRAIRDIRFSDENLRYLEGLKLFRPEFLRYLSTFRFSGDIYAVEEGEVVFPKEPLLRVHGSAIETQLIESVVLNVINFQTLIATKAARIATAAGGKAVMEFGLRRAHGPDGALSASRAAFIGGAGTTSNLCAGKLFGIPVSGTMAHSWVMAFGSEQEAFAAYARLYPERTIALVDTYNTLESGIPGAIRVFRKLKRKGVRSFGIRLDSGDLEYLSKRARALLDRAGLPEAVIVASNELDETIIEQLVSRGAPIDFFGVGTKMVTAHGDSALSGIYKLAARREGKRLVPVIKISNNPEKVTSPHVKNILRTFDRNGQMIGDLLFLEGQRRRLEGRVRRGASLVYYQPEYRSEHLTVRHYGSADILLRPVMKRGEIICGFPPLPAVREKARRNLQRLHPTYRRLLNPHIYKVSVTRELLETKTRLIEEYSRSLH